MQVFKDPKGQTSSTRIGGFLLIGVSVVFAVLGGFVPPSAPVMLPMSQGSLWAGVTLLTGGKVTEKITKI